MASPAYPNVPATEGVPAVKRDATNPGTGTETPLTEDGDEIAVQGVKDWGVFTKDGSKALDPDSIMSVGYSAESRIADYPIEEGGFEDYDKVAMPFENRVVMTKGGKAEDRRAFLAAVEEIRTDTELYTVSTPERAYLNVNISRVSIDRSREQGAGLISVEIALVEIRANAVATFSKAKDPASADTQSNGAVQAAPADTATQSRVAEKAPAIKAPAATSAAGRAALDMSAITSIQTIPLIAGIPSQGLAVNLAQNAVDLVFSQKRSGLFADIAVNGVQAVAGALVRDGVPLLKGILPSFPGDLALIDMIGNADPDYSGLGDRFKLIWAS